MVTGRLNELFDAFPAVAVVGARQVGKSTLLRETFGATARVIEFDPVVDVEGARSDPDLFLAGNPTPLILDEIQYAPELVAALKRTIDRARTPGQYLMTGSQQWGVLKSLAESLAGRVVFLDLEGFSLAEASLNPPAHTWIDAWLSDPAAILPSNIERLPMPFSVHEHIWRGFLPEAQFLARNVVPDFHAAYQRTYIERDVRLLADISDWQLFGRFVRLLAALTAQEINHSQLGREIGVTPQTAGRWLEVLRATFQWFELPAYHGNAIKRLSGKPKGYIGDTGAASALQAISSPEALAGHPLWGPLFESTIVTDIRKQCLTLAVRPHCYHWRAYSGAEVDLILERDGQLYPIEVKGHSRIGKKDCLGLKAFRETYSDANVAPGLVVAPVDRAYRLTEHDMAMPWDALIARG